jgi:hypothetical protein
MRDRQKSVSFSSPLWFLSYAHILDFRCACRYCRFQKCVAVGMKREGSQLVKTVTTRSIAAIQFERDCIGSPKKRRMEQPERESGGSGSEQPSPATVGGHASNPSPPQTVHLSPADTQPPSTGRSMGSQQEPMRVIEMLMEMESRVSHEMSTRYRSSVITSASASVSLSDAVQSPSQFGHNSSGGVLVSSCSFLYGWHLFRVDFSTDCVCRVHRRSVSHLDRAQSMN